MRWSWLLEGAEEGDPTLTQVLGEDMAEGLLSRRAGLQMLGDKPASLVLSGGPVTPRLKQQGRWPDISVTS